MIHRSTYNPGNSNNDEHKLVNLSLLRVS